jgi:two-component system copper resistance phosphate regulon response regulator CusR
VPGLIEDEIMRILVIEDETGIANMICRGLEQARYTVDVARDGTQGLEKALENTYSLIILDLMLPGIDGWRVCEELRSRRDKTPILMLTARDTVEDRVRGLDTGADDYLPKPFDFQELLARVRALLRRDKMHRARIIRVADLEIDTAQRRVTRGGIEIGLSHREYELLEALAAHESRVLTREVIQERIWMDEESYSNTVDVYIGMLRKKIDAGHSVKLIQTVRGAGYTLRLPEGENEKDEG